MSTTTLSYRLSTDVLDAHPGYCRGVVVVQGADNRRDAPALAALLREAEAQLREAVRGNVAEHARIAAWREAYRRFGAKPSEHRASIEAMARRVLKPDALPSINPLVDIGNIVSLRHLLPAGVHPLGAGEHVLALRRAQAGDGFAPPDGGPLEAPPEGEIVFADGARVLTRRWTWRQAASTQTLPETERVFFNIDGLPPTPREDVLAAMHAVQALVREHTGGEVVAAQLLSAEQPAMDLRFG